MSSGDVPTVKNLISHLWISMGFSMGQTVLMYQRIEQGIEKCWNCTQKRNELILGVFRRSETGCWSYPPKGG